MNIKDVVAIAKLKAESAHDLTTFMAHLMAMEASGEDTTKIIQMLDQENEVTLSNLTNLTTGTIMNYYERKDFIKFEVCNALITRGAPNSSSAKYAVEGIKGLDLKLNPAVFSSTDIVGISVNGKRANRVSFDKGLLKVAIDAKCKFVTDSVYHTNRSFNVGEREVVEFLTDHNFIIVYASAVRSVWQLDEPDSVGDL